MTQACRAKGRLKVPAFIALKSSPASPAFTACSTHPRLNTVYESSTEQYRPAERRDSRQFAHTVQSDHGTYQMLWEEPDSSLAESTVTLLLNPEVNVFITEDQTALRANSPLGSIPLDRVGTKLAAWNWERETADESSSERSEWLPLLPLTESEERRRVWLADNSPATENPPGPPNTGRSSQRHSDLHTPIVEQVQDEDSEESAIELNVKGLLAKAPLTALPTPRVATPVTDYLSVPRRRSSLPASPSINRELWQLPSEDIRFRSHRDSVEITAGHLRRREIEGRVNQELLTGHKDSFILNKSKFAAKYPSALTVHGSTWNRFGGLSPILDMSPPDSQRGTWGSMDEAAGKGAVDERYHADEHKDCPICDEHRPRWFEANCRKGRLGSKE